MFTIFPNEAAFIKFCRERWAEKADIVIKDDTGLWLRNTKDERYLDVEMADKVLEEEHR